MTEKELTEQKNDLITRAEKTLETAKTENRELTDAEMAELAEIRDDVREIKAKLAEMFADDLRELAKTEEKSNQEEKKMNENTETRALDEEAAFSAFIRGQMNERDGELTPASGVGGVLIPKTITNRIIKKVYDICPVLERSYRFNTKGDLVIPYYPADSNNITVAYQSEFSDLSSSTGKFTSINLGRFLAGCLTKISRILINNTDIDIVAFIVDEMAYAIKRFVEKELINPSDPSNKVKGLSELTNGITAAATDAITADEVVKLHDKVKDEFLADACWIMSPATRTALRLLKDEMGRYLLQDDVSLPFGSSLLGKPVFVSDNMEDIAASKTVIYFGDLKGLAVNFSEQISVEVLREHYAAQHAVGVVGWFQFDARVCDQQKLAKLTMAAS